MAFDVMGFLAANGMLPGMQRSAQQSPQQSAPIFNALLEQSVPPQPVPLGIAPSPAPEPMPLGVATPEMYGPPGGYEPMLRPTAFERELYGAPPAEIMSNQAFGMMPPIEPPTGPVVRPSMAAVNLPPLPPPGFASRRPAPTMGFAQPAAVSGMAPMQPAQTEYPSMFDLFLAAQPDEDLAYNAQLAEEPAAPVEAPVAKQEKDKELESWQPGSVFTIADPADKEGKKKISVDTFTPTSQQGKGSARITTSRGTIYVDESSKLWPQIESRYQQLIGGYQQRAAKDLPTPPNNQYGHAVILPDGTKAPAMFDANGDMIVEDPTYGSVRMDPTDIDPKNIIFPIDPRSGKPDQTQYQNAIKAISKGVMEPLQAGIQTALGAAQTQRYGTAQQLAENAKFAISYDDNGLPTYTVIDDPAYPPGFRDQLQKEFDLDRAAMEDEVKSLQKYVNVTGESIKDARIRQRKEEIEELRRIAAGTSSSAALTPTITPDEANKSIAQKQQEIEDILSADDKLRLGNTVVLESTQSPTVALSFNPASWASVSAGRRGRQMAAGNPEAGAVVSPEEHGRFIASRAAYPYTQQLGGLSNQTMTEQSSQAIQAVNGRINNIVNDTVGQFGNSSKRGIKAREDFANEPVTFTYTYGGEQITETMPLQQATNEFRDAVAGSSAAIATRSSQNVSEANEKLLKATRRFSGDIYVPYADNGTTYEASDKEKNLIYSIFQTPLNQDVTVTTPMTMAGDVRVIQPPPPITGDIPAPSGGPKAAGVPSQIMPIFRIPGLKTDAGDGVGRLGLGSGSAILNTIANAPAEQSATTKWLEASGVGKSAGTAIENLSNALHGDGKPGSANDPKQVDAVKKAIKDANDEIQASPALRKEYFNSFHSLMSDLGFEFGSSQAAFSSDLEKVYQGLMSPSDFINRYNKNEVYAKFSATPLAKSLQRLSMHHKEINVSEKLRKDSAGNIIPEEVQGLKFTQDVGERLQALVYSVAQLRGNVNPLLGNGVFQLKSGARTAFFPSPYDSSVQSFLAVPDIARGAFKEYPVMTAEQQAKYQQDKTLPPALTSPYDLPAMHAIMSLQSGKMYTDLGNLINTLAPIIEAKNSNLGALMAGNHGASGNRRASINTQRIKDDDGPIFGASSRTAGYQGFSDVLVNYAILPNKRTMWWRSK